MYPSTEGCSPLSHTPISVCLFVCLSVCLSLFLSARAVGYVLLMLSRHLVDCLPLDLFPISRMPVHSSFCPPVSLHSRNRPCPFLFMPFRKVSYICQSCSIVFLFLCMHMILSSGFILSVFLPLLLSDS